MIDIVYVTLLCDHRENMKTKMYKTLNLTSSDNITKFTVLDISIVPIYIIHNTIIIGR